MIHHFPKYVRECLANYNSKEIYAIGTTPNSSWKVRAHVSIPMKFVRKSIRTKNCLVWSCIGGGTLLASLEAFDTLF